MKYSKTVLAIGTAIGSGIVSLSGAHAQTVNPAPQATDEVSEIVVCR